MPKKMLLLAILIDVLLIAFLFLWNLELISLGGNPAVNRNAQGFATGALLFVTAAAILIGLHEFAKLKGLYSLGRNPVGIQIRSLLGSQINRREEKKRDGSLSTYQDQLLKNKELFDKGVLSEDEYNLLQAKIKSRML